MSESISSNGKTDNLGFFQYVFNFDEDNKAAILNMIQYTIINHILQDRYTIKQLINLIAFDKTCNKTYSYLESFITNLQTHNIIEIINDKLVICNQTVELKIDITSVNIMSDNMSRLSPPIELEINKESIEYLRYMILVRMFKHNSTRSFKLDNIINDVVLYIYSSNLNENLISIYDINQSEVYKCITYIERRDIIEKINEDEYKYVL